MKWKQDNIPDLSDKLAIITGANSGLGYQIALALAGRHCHVILACRNLVKATVAKEAILATYPKAQVSVELLDISSLRSIHDFAVRIKSQYSRINLLINNAAALNVTSSELTADGFGLIMGTNCIGPFALTAHLLPLLERANDARIVTVSSDSHKFVSFNEQDLTSHEGNYLKLYAKSKLANLLFTFELAKRLNQANSHVLSLAAHPGFAATQLSDVKVAGASKFFANFFHFGMKLVAQSAADGALPMLYAATATDATNGDFYGPDGWFGLKGYPTKQIAARNAYDSSLASLFWDRCVALANITINITYQKPQVLAITNTTTGVLSTLNPSLDFIPQNNPVTNPVTKEKDTDQLTIIQEPLDALCQVKSPTTSIRYGK